MKRGKVIQLFNGHSSLLDDPIIYKTLFENSPYAILLLNTDASIHEVNHSFATLTGYDKDEITLQKIITGSNINRFNSIIIDVINGKKQEMETTIVTKLMNYLDIQMTFLPIEANNKITGIFVVIVDLTEVKEQRLKIEENLNYAQMISKTGSWEYDVIEDEAYWSNQMYSIFAVEDNENFIPTYDKFFDFVHPKDLINLQKVVNQSINNGTSFSCESRIKRKDNTERTLRLKANAILDESGKTVRLIGTCHDITDQKKTEEKIKYLATHDYLTELSNRMLFHKSLSEHLRYCKDTNKIFAILYIDIDRFKTINDTLGHFIGYQLIIEISNRIQEVVRNERIFRMGGDEFTIILSDIKDDQYPLKIAQKIQDILKASFMVNGYELFMTASIGISIFPESGDNEESLLRSATTAISRAKQLGKNNIQVHNKITNDEAFKRYCLEKDMRKALKKQQFEVYYQPRVCTITGALKSAEALIRWNHPEWGLVRPDEFISLAEESGFIHHIGEFVLTNVCAQFNEWQQNGFQVVPISVNVSAKSIFRNDFVSSIVSTFEKTKLNTSLLELEITESSFLDNLEKVIEVISELKQYQIKVALDDFGTGFSSLTYLKTLSVDTIKIDRSFIKNITNSKQDETITSCIIQLAHGLNMEVVAEGVESTDQLELLKQKKCDQIQGYLYSKPIQANEFISFLEKKE